MPGLPPASAFPSPSPARCRCRHGGGGAAQGATPDRLLRRARGDREVRGHRIGGQRGTLGTAGTGVLEPGCALGLCPEGPSSMLCQILMCWGCSQPSLDAPVPAKGGEPGWLEQSQVWGPSMDSPGGQPGLWAAPGGAGTCPSCSGKGTSPAPQPSYPPLPPSLHCRGAFSYLRRVTEKSSRLDFAAKFVPGRTKAKQSARRELHILSQLDHERIVFFHDAFEKKNAVIMVMELYPPGAALGACGVGNKGRLLGGQVSRVGAEELGAQEGAGHVGAWSFCAP